jgi:hypothetical protein
MAGLTWPGDVDGACHGGREREGHRHQPDPRKGERGALGGEDEDGRGQELGNRVAERAGRVRGRGKAADIEPAPSRPHG